MGTKVVINTRYQGSFRLSTSALALYAQRKGGVLKTSRRSDCIQFPDGRMFIPRFDDRTDADLIAVIEALGTDAASGECCQLEIVTIPDDVTQWFISEGDGDESVYEGWRGREFYGKAVKV